MKKTLFLLLIASQPLLADSYVNIDGSYFPAPDDEDACVTQTAGAGSAVTDTQKTYYWDAEDASLDINYDYDVAALYTNSDVSDFYIIGKNGNINLTTELGAIYLSYAHFYSDCVLTTNQTKEDTAYGKPQIIIEGAEIHSDITLNTVSATLRNNLLYTSASVVVNGGPLIVQGVSGSNALLEAKSGINLDTTKSSYEYDVTKGLTLISAGTITIGEEGTIGSDIHTLSGVSSLAVNYTGNGGDGENFDVVNNDIVKSNVTIQAANGRVDAGILNGSGSSIIIAKLMYLTKFDGGSLTTETSGATWIKGDLVATGSLSLTGSTVELQGEIYKAADNLTLKATATQTDEDTTATLTSAETGATYIANNISLTGKSIDMSGTFSGGTLQATATDNLKLVTLGKTGTLIGATTLTSSAGNISVGSFVGSSSLTATAAGTLTIGSATAEGAVDLKAGNIAVSGSVISTVSSGTSTLNATGGAITISGALTVTDTAELTAGDDIRVFGAVSAEQATFTTDGDKDITIGSFSGRLLTIAQAGDVTLGAFDSTGAESYFTANLTSGTLTVTGAVGSSANAVGIFKAKTTSGNMTFQKNVSAYCLNLTAEGNMVFEKALTPAAQAYLTAKGSITAAGTASLAHASELHADTLTFGGGLTAKGLTVRASDGTGKATLSLGGDLSLGQDSEVSKKSDVKADISAAGHNVTITDSAVDGSVSDAKDVTLTNSTIGTLSMSGALISEGTVTISNQTAGLTTTSLTLNGGTLTLGNHNVNLTTSALNIEAKSTLNANLVLLSGAEVTLAEGTSIDLGCTLTLTDSTSFTLSEQLTPGTAITLMSGVDELITNGSAWTTDGDTVSTRLAEVKNEDGTYTYTTGAKSGSLKMTYDKTSGEGGTIVMTPEPATATLSLLALAGLAARRCRK